MEGVEGGAIRNIMRKGELERGVRRAVRIKMDQEIQGYWNKIDKSEFWKDY